MAADISNFDALVIRESDYGENDKLLTVITAEHGKCTIIAKGARSLRSKFMSLCLLFNYGNFEFYKKNGLRWLSGGDIQNTFFDTKGDIEQIALANYILSLAGEITGENVPCESILRTTLNTLYAIENKLKPLPQIKSAYEIFAAHESGMSPDMSGCAVCGCKAHSEGFWLDVMNGCVFCAQCQSRRGGQSTPPVQDDLRTASILLPLDNSSVAAWRYVMSAPPKRILAFSQESEQSARLLERATESYIVNHLERSFATLDFYHEMKE